MGEIFAWILANLTELGAALAALYALASVIVALTPGEGDDRFLGKVRKALEFLSVLQPKDSAGSVKLPLTAPAERPLFEGRPTRMDRR